MPSPRTVQGTAVSPGLAIGPVYVVLSRPEHVPVWSVREEDVAAEIERLHQAVGQAEAELARRQEQVATDAGEKDAEIFAVHRMILQDPKALTEVEGTIREQRINAEKSVQDLIDRFEKTMGRLEGNYSRSYASDFSDPWFGVLDALLERDRQRVMEREEAVVLAAAELTPQAVTYLSRERILAVVAEEGGRFSHGAVLARSMGIPCVVGLPDLVCRLEQGMLVSVDGDRGNVQLRPDQDDIDAFLDRRARIVARRQALREHAARPAVTPDGTGLDVRVNIESIRDLDTFDLEHCDGVGLLRTEFQYLERPQFPSEDEQFRIYRRVLERLEAKPVVIRTLDIGGDKPLPYFQTPKEANPALGWRGLRISLQWRDLLQIQLRALLRASVHGNLRILLPMVTSLEEVLEVRQTFQGVRKRLVQQGYEVVEKVPVGIMIEVPSLLFVLPHILEHVDFVAVGTNDLVQYLLATDRDNTWVSELYDPLHPAVIQARARAAPAARQADTPCSVCGEMAGDPAVALLLLGMGFDSVSVSPSFLPEIKYGVSQTTAERATAIVAEALAQTTCSGVRGVMESVRRELYDHPSDESCAVGN